MHDQNMEPRAAFDGSPAGSPPRTSARRVSFELINQIKLAGKGHAPRTLSGLARASWLKSSLLFFTTALWCLALRGAAYTNAYEFEKSIPKPESIQWEANHRFYKERQELYRKRMAIPDAVGTNVPIAAGTYLGFDRKTAAAPTPSLTVVSALPGIFFKLFFFTVMFFFCGFFVVRRFAPHVLAGLHERFNWAFTPVTARIFPAKIRAEEEAFSEFLAEFRIGPSVPSSSRAPDPIKEFFMQATRLLGTQRALLREIIRESGGLARQKKLVNLRAGLGVLKDGAVFPETLPVWQVAAALEGFLRQLIEKMGNVTPSTLRTVGGGLDLLGNLCAPGLKPDLLLAGRPLKFLVVDDDLISRQALSLSLNKGFSQPDLAVDGETALVQINQQAYDVIFLDVQMPGMDGFELCLKIRDTALNGKTPVVFVSSQCDFDARTRSTLSGGNDLMGKPFLTFEITVKALTLALSGRLCGARKTFQTIEHDQDQVRSVTSSTIVPRRSPVPPKNMFTQAFLTRAATHLGPLRDLCRKILQTPDVEVRQSLLAAGFLRINSLTSKTGLAVVHPGHQMSAALEGLLRKLLENPKSSTASTLATVAAAVDLLADLCVPGLPADLAVNPPIRMLVVDDDLIARRAITGVLQTTFEKPESVENGEAALALAAGKPFDVIFLDVIMPGMDGFEVCAKIRGTAPNRATPVVFVTSQDDAPARDQMHRSGGNDLLGKPFLTSEITVKALTFALRGRLDQLKVAPC
jgi:CheY-like chemotaxis protein